MNERQRKLLFRAHRRGFKEMDLLMGSFAEQHIADMDDGELDQFEALLQTPDWEVYNWILDRAPVPENHASKVLDQLKAFKYSAQPG